MKHPFRLRHRADFQRLRTVGKVQRHPSMVLSYATNTLQHNRYGFIISGRMGGAVVRNRLKRQLRACVWQHHPHLSTSYDMIIIARQPIHNLDFAGMCQVLQTLFQRANLL